MKDSELLILKVLRTPRARQQFLLHWLKSHWPEILGHTGASHSQPYRLEEGVLYVHTDNPMWSNQFHMMQGKLLNQLNRLLVPALQGRKRLIRELKFYHGVIEEEPQPRQEAKPFMPRRDDSRKCPLCGVPLIGDEEICSGCRRKQQEELRREIRKQLDLRPWLRYEDCRELVKCDRITFTDVKAVLEEWALNRALDPRATAGEKAFAVMVETGLRPEALSEETIRQTLEKAEGDGLMYLHVGNNYVVRCDEIIGIFDIRNKRTNIYRFFLKPRLGGDNVVDLTEDYPPASCVVTRDKIILSGISSRTLRKR